jgi:hypothetical protein
MARTGPLLTEAQWKKIAPLLPQPPKHRKGGRPWINRLLTDSGRLNDGCRSVRKQVFAGANPTVTYPLWFRHRL